MIDNSIIKLQASLSDAINDWLISADLAPLDIYIPDHAAELMASSAFNILLALKDQTEYMEREGHLKV